MESVQYSKIDQLCEHVVRTRFHDIPKDVIEQSKKMLLDTLGALIRASSKRYPAGKILTKFAKDQGGKPVASIINRGFKTNLVNAALVNGTFGYYCDVESHHVEAVAHVAAVIVPTSLAISEAYGLSGKDLLTALVVGYDVETRVSNALDPTQLYKRGFHPSCVAGCFGAAAAAGSLLKLNEERQKMAFGLAGCQASGLLAWATDHSENSRPFQMGVAARNGVTAALLARDGFGAPPSIFEGKNGLFNAFSDGPKPERLVEDLGKRFTIMEAAFKLYSCCAFLHPGADALLSILQNNNVNHKQIAEIALRFPKPGASIIDNNELKSHNAQYILPILAVNGEVNIEDILFERRSDPEINRLSKNTRLVYDEELGPVFPEKYTSVVIVKTKDGKTFEEKVEYAKGTPQNPVGFDIIEDKFRKLTARELSKAKVEKCIVTVKEFEDLAKITPIINLIKG
jgi:2-methylcitrate dehydratase PrpD